MGYAAWDARDLFAARGARLRLSPSGLTLVTALTSAVLRIRELPAVAWPRPWRRLPRPAGRLPSPAVLRVAPSPGQVRRSVR